MCCCDCQHSIDPKNLKFLIKIVGYILGVIGGLAVLYGVSFGVLLPFTGKNFEHTYYYDAKLYAGTIIFFQGMGFLLIAGLSYFIIVGVNNLLLKRFVIGSYICCGFGVYTSIASVAFFAFTAMSVYKAYENDEQACLKGEIFREANHLYKEAQQVLCTEDCKCHISDPEIYSEQQLEGLQYKEDKGAINIMGCRQYEQILAREENEFEDMEYNHTDLITTMEVTFDCAGICEKSPIYLFSDVNRGAPVSNLSCFQAMEGVVDRYGFIVFFVGWIIAIIIFFSLISACLLCCSRIEFYQVDFNLNISQSRDNIYYQRIQQLDNDHSLVNDSYASGHYHNNNNINNVQQNNRMQQQNLQPQQQQQQFQQQQQQQNYNNINNGSRNNSPGRQQLDDSQRVQQRSQLNQQDDQNQNQNNNN